MVYVVDADWDRKERSVGKNECKGERRLKDEKKKGKEREEEREKERKKNPTANIHRDLHEVGLRPQPDREPRTHATVATL